MLPLRKVATLSLPLIFIANTGVAEEIFISDREYSSDEVEHLEFATVNNGSSTSSADFGFSSSSESSSTNEPNYLSDEEERLIEEALAYSAEPAATPTFRELTKDDVSYNPAALSSRQDDDRIYGFILGTAFAPDTGKRIGAEDAEGFWPGVQIGLGTKISQSVNFEINAWTDSIDQSDSGQGGYERRGIGAQIQWFFAESNATHPYALLGAGIQNTRVDNYLTVQNYEAQNEIVDVGLGMLFRSRSNGLSLRTEIRNRSDFLDRPQQGRQTLNEWMLAIGLQMPFGSNPEPSEPEEIIIEEPQIIAVLDTDGDGVDDSRDQCPQTIVGVAVDTNGCEPKSEEPIQQCSDDIVTDIECLPREMAVVLFGSDSASLSNKGKATLTRLADQMKAIDNFSVIVTGHTDSLGDADYNLALSYRRAEAVKVFLVHKGVPEDRVRVATLGESAPTSDNDTLEGRQKNRRVVAEKIAF